MTSLPNTASPVVMQQPSQPMVIQQPQQGFSQPTQSVQNNWNMPQLGQPQMQFMKPSLPAKLINSPEEIVAQDVPMDGSVSLFLMSDLSAILAKQWNSKGTIDTVRFVREIPSESQQESQADSAYSELKTVISERLDNIEKLLKQQNHPYYRKPNKYGKQNKEDSQKED